MIKWNGRPPKYNKPEEMQVLIDEYFAECEAKEIIPTITGLAYTLDLTRESLLDYEKCLETDRFKRFDLDVKRGFVDTIKRAKKYIQMQYENALYQQGKTVGAIFTLKNNYGWVDKKEVEQTSKTITVELDEE